MTSNFVATSKNRMNLRSLWMAATLLAAAVICSPAFSANYPLELTNIKPSGSMNANHRHYRAYPGIEYNIRAAVIGGDYPYTYSLTNAPSGMTINASTGEISWPNPQTSASPTITVRDTAARTVSATWTINVTTTGFKFVDATNGQAAPTGTGTLSNPWRTMRDVFNGTTSTDIVYYRAGTYNQLDLTRGGVGGDWEGVVWNGKSNMWLAYPGTRPIIDFGYRSGGTERAPLIRVADDLVYIDGFEAANMRLIGFQFTGMRQGPTFRRLRMHNLGPGIDGSNASFIMTMISTDIACDGGVIQDSEFYNLTGNATTLKLYSQRKLLVEDTIHHDVTTGIEVKADNAQFTLRNNRFYAITGNAIGGNMNYATTTGEILYNLIRNTNALRVNNDSAARAIWIYRNTFVGNVVVASTDAADGPFTFNNNVIQNSNGGTGITFEEVTAPSRVSIVNNLTGTSRVDTNGNLTTANAQYIGTHGYQQGPAGSVPRPPTNVTARP